MTQLATSFEEYSAWRDGLSAEVRALRDWLEESQLLEGEVGQRLDGAIDRLAEDRLMIAFVAEFSRGKSELINAIFFANYGKRILPSSAGRTTMCPTELMYDESLPPSIRGLPIETRARLGSTMDFKKAEAEWVVHPLNTDSADGMLEAFRLVAETVKVSVDEARMYGLYDPDDADQAVVVDDDGMIEISRWRHAIINFPHPLLKHGLVILDTPGLNAIGTEPELTLSLVPSAHAVLFVLAADTGVTKSDLDVWRRIVGEGPAASGHLAILNKIDGLWDPLRSEDEIDGEIARQVQSVAHTLGMQTDHVLPVSAQKGLVAKVTLDTELLLRSRLPTLELALVDMLVPAKRRIVREQTLAVTDRIQAELRHSLVARERGIVEQLYELRSLQGKNQSSIERMVKRAEAEQQEFEENVKKLVATRVVLNRLADVAYRPLEQDTVRDRVSEAKERMRKVRLTMQFLAAARDYFDKLREQLRLSNGKLREIEQMVLGVHRNFAENLGWKLQPPMAFSLDNYLAELERVENVYKSHFGALTLLTRDKWGLIERFFDTVVGKTREVFSAAERDAEAWVRSLLPPLELQVRDQRLQLRRRTESVMRVRDAQASLGDQITQLEATLEDLNAKLEHLKRLTARIRAASQFVEPEPEDEGLPRISMPVDPDAPGYLRVEI
jgi:hypothetical protein